MGSWGAALPLLGSLPILKGQQTVGLPAAALHSDVDKLRYKCRCLVLEAVLQHLEQDLFVQPKEAQGRHEGIFHHGYTWRPVPKDLLQLLTHPRQKGLEESWLVPEEERPGDGLKVAQRSPSQLHRLLLCCCRAVGMWMPRSSSCLVADD